MQTIHDIIKAAGDGRTWAGAERLAKATRGSLKPISIDAVYRWPRMGIPDVHWPVVMALVPNLTADQLMRLNIEVRYAQAAKKQAKTAA